MHRHPRKPPSTNASVAANPNAFAFRSKPQGLVPRMIHAFYDLPRIMLSAASMAPLEVLHYYRTPKTGSSALLQHLVHAATPVPCHFGSSCLDDTRTFEQGCGRGRRLRLTIHDHTGGCKRNVCNGSAAGASSFAVLRDPCERFESVLDQVSRLPTAPRDMGVSFAGRHNATDAFAAFVSQLLAGCDGDDVGCALRALDARVTGDTRIFLYPQAYFLPADHPEASIVCYDAAQLGERLNRFLAVHTRCASADSSGAEGAAASTTTTTSGAAASAADAGAPAPTNGSGTSTHHLGASAAVFGARLPQRNWRPHPSSEAGAATSAHEQRQQRTRESSAWCRTVHQIYARDARLWRQHCAPAGAS